MIFRKSAFRKSHRFFVDLGANLPPFSSQSSPTFHSKSIFKGIKKICDFRIDFYTVSAPTWNHLGPQVGAILVLRIAQEPPRTPPKTHLGARTRPDAQNGSKMEPPTLQNDPQTLHVRFILDWFLIDFSSVSPPNLPPQTHSNQWKIDAKRHSVLDFKV